MASVLLWASVQRRLSASVQRRARRTMKEKENVRRLGTVYAATCTRERSLTQSRARFQTSLSPLATGTHLQFQTSLPPGAARAALATGTHLRACTAVLGEDDRCVRSVSEAEFEEAFEAAFEEAFSLGLSLRTDVFDEDRLASVEARVPGALLGQHAHELLGALAHGEERFLGELALVAFLATATHHFPHPRERKVSHPGRQLITCLPGCTGLGSSESARAR